jgi:hypothetical protein
MWGLIKGVRDGEERSDKAISIRSAQRREIASLRSQ